MSTLPLGWSDLNWHPGNQIARLESPNSTLWKIQFLYQYPIHPLQWPQEEHIETCWVLEPILHSSWNTFGWRIFLHKQKPSLASIITMQGWYSCYNWLTWAAEELTSTRSTASLTIIYEKAVNTGNVWHLLGHFFTSELGILYLIFYGYLRLLLLSIASPDNLYDPPPVMKGTDICCIWLLIPTTKFLWKRINPNDKPLLTTSTTSVRCALPCHQSWSRVTPTWTWISR